MPRPKGSKNVVHTNFPEGRELEIVEVPEQDISITETLPDEKGQGVSETLEGDVVVLDKKESEKLNTRFQGKPNFIVRPDWEVKEFIDTADVYEGSTFIRTYAKHIHGDNFLDLAHQIVAKFNTKK
jgi:hypothetical protein